MDIAVTATELEGVCLVETGVATDERGYFSEVYVSALWQEAGIPDTFVQDNLSMSARGTLRGLHYQLDPHGMGKLVRAITGSIFDVAVDIRHGSPTFGRHVSVVLSNENWAQIWVPVGFAHGFCTLEPDTEVIYKVTDYYSPECERGIKWDDAEIDIEWPVVASEAIVSDKDARNPPLAKTQTYFKF